MQILVVDDIQIIRSGIISAINSRYSQVSFLQAENGKDALDIALKNNIELIITDLKMPVCDGLTMIENLRSIGFDKPIIILTGFGEFSLAEKALNMGVEGYLLKPIENEALFSSIEKAMKKLNKNQIMRGLQEENRLLNEQQKQAALSQKIQQALFLPNAKTEISKFEGCVFCLAVITVDPDFHSQTQFQHEEAGLIRYAVLNIIEYLELEQNFFALEHFTQQRQSLILFYATAAELLLQNALLAVQRIKYELENTVSIPVSFGISDVRENIDNILYNNAISALGQKLIHGRNGVFCYQDSCKTVVSEQDAGLLELYINQHDLNNFSLLLNAILLKYSKQDSLTGIVSALMPFLLELLISCCGGQAFSLAGELENTANHLGDMHSIDELASNFVNIFKNAFDAENITPKQEENMALSVRNYIDLHYRESISVKELAEKFSLNYSYLSSLFAKEVGLGIVAYLTQVRIETAKTLLSGSASDIAEIAALVGYDDLQYFYRIFKKQTGQTPLAFRNSQKKSNE